MFVTHNKNHSACYIDRQSSLSALSAFSPKVIFHVYVFLKFSQIDINFILRLLQQSLKALCVLWYAEKPGFLDWLVISSRLGNLLSSFVASLCLVWEGYSALSQYS